MNHGEKYFFEKGRTLSLRAKTTDAVISQYSGNNAWNYNGTNGNMNANNKNNSNSVRATLEFLKVFIWL